MPTANRTDEQYWAEYDGLQHAKHELLRHYLGGWFPILASWSGRVLYLDCHAGRGRHETGHEGSPILALRLLCNHQLRDRILASTKIGFFFFEVSQSNYESLCAEVGALGKLPEHVEVYPIPGNYEESLRRIVEGLRRRNQRLAPAFAFLDPYGFSLPMGLLNGLLAFPKCEMLVNFMYRYVDMAMRNPAQADNLDALFGCTEWRKIVGIEDHEQRADRTIDLFSQQLRAEFVTHMYMRAANGVLKYVLLHATNHARGRELMKQAMWSVTPDGSFTAFERNDPRQMVLIQADPDLDPLRDRLWARFAGQSVRVDQISEWLQGELYLEKHVHKILREYRQQGVVQFTDYGSRFAFSQNPLAHFPPERPADC